MLFGPVSHASVEECGEFERVSNIDSRQSDDDSMIRSVQSYRGPKRADSATGLSQIPGAETKFNKSGPSFRFDGPIGAFAPTNN